MPVIIVTALLSNKIDTGSFFNKRLKNRFFLACCLFYFVEMLLLIISGHASGKLMLLKSAMVVTPLMVCCSYFPAEDVFKKLMKVYVIIVATVLTTCIAIAAYKYFTLHVQDIVFFYHNLVLPFKQHAIQVAILVFIAILHLLENARRQTWLLNKTTHFILLVYLTCCIVLLSSKLVIIFTAVSYLYYIYLFFKSNIKLRLLTIVILVGAIAMIMLALAGSNRVSKRFNELLEGNIDLVYKEDYNPAVYFNGLQFRMLQWRLVKEILQEKKAWLFGVSDEAQQLLDQKYTSLHMYIGDPKRGDHGYLGYNTHNQLLESLLRTGILGLLTYIFLWATLIHLAWKRRNRKLIVIVILLLAYCFNESMLERQYSIILFTFFPLFFYYARGRNDRLATASNE